MKDLVLNIFDFPQLMNNCLPYINMRMFFILDAGSFMSMIHMFLMCPL